MTDMIYENPRRMTDDQMQQSKDHKMPMNARFMAYDRLVEWLKSRKEAGRAIDIRTCQIAATWVNVHDPYGVLVEPGAVDMVIGVFVRSPNSRGWIIGGDLPEEKERVARDHSEVEGALYLAARDAHPDWQVDFFKFDNERHAARLRGDDLIDWFVKSFPEKAGAIEAKVRAEQVQRRVKRDQMTTPASHSLWILRCGRERYSARRYREPAA